MGRSLPRSTDELRGLRAARWVRESTQDQYDRYGPQSQHENMDRFVERYGLVDSGLVFTVAESGKTVWRSTTMRSMVEAARAGWFDILLTGYFDRWQRNLRRTLELVEDELHASGVGWVMCDRRLLSSDPRDWDQMITEAHEAERYSRRLGERITDGYAVKFHQHHDQAGNAPLGFRRDPDDEDLFAGGRPRNHRVGDFHLRAICDRACLPRPARFGLWARCRTSQEDAHQSPVQRIHSATPRSHRCAPSPCPVAERPTCQR
jgi:DNA invertase Pin-like site-specific DNA recombinase